MGLQLELEKSLTENLEANNIPTSGGRRRRRRGGADDEVEAAVPAARYALTKVLKSAYDALKPAGSAVTQAGVAAAIIYAADQSFRGGLCDPLAKSLASTMSVVPMAAAYVSSCDNAMTAYNTAVTSAALMVAPLLWSALKTAGSLFVSDEAVETVATELVEAAKDPGAAAAKAMATREKAKAAAPAASTVKAAPIFSMKSKAAMTPTPSPGSYPANRKKAGKRSRKTKVRARKTRRAMPTFVY